jgi:predicted DNA-binding transcriptional regulator AlpA
MKMAEAIQSGDLGLSGDNGGSPTSLNLDPVSAKRLLEMIQQMLETTLKRMLAEVAGRPAPSAGQGPDESNPSSPKKTGIDLNSIEKLKAADLRVALLIGKTPENSGLLIDVKMLAKLLAISKSMLWHLHAVQALPAPIRIGRLNRWKLAEIIEWIEAGCPPQSHWSYRNPGASKKGGK